MKCWGADFRISRLFLAAAARRGKAGACFDGRRPLTRLPRAVSFLFAIGLVGCSVASDTKPTPPVPLTSSTTKERAELPSYSLGDRWIRSDGIYELIRIEKDRYVFSAGPGNEIELTKDLAPVKSVLTWSVTFEFTPPPTLSWPFEVGKRGSVRGSFKPLYAAEPYPAELTWVVEAYEDVEVPAGTFKAFRISFKVEPRVSTNFGRQGWGQSGPSTVTHRVWYAPEARRFVKAESLDNWYMRYQVIAVDPDESAPLKVDVWEPKDQTRLGGTGETTVTGNITGGKGVARVTVSLNGEVVSRKESAASAKKAVVLNVPLTLREGKNVLLVTATDPAGVSTQQARTLLYEPPLRVALPPAGQPARVPREEIVLGGTIRGPWPRGVLWYSLALNGVVASTGDVAGKSEIALEAAMMLKEGKNLLTLSFIGGEESAEPQEFTLILDKTAPVPPVQIAAATPTPPPPQRPVENPATVQPPAPAPPAVPKTPQTTPAPTTPPVPASPTPTSKSPIPAAPAASVPAAAPSPPPTPGVVASLPPLQVALSSPRDQTRFEQETVGLAGLVSGGKGVNRVIVALNGVEISRQEERTPQRAVTVNLPVKLREGQNTLVITASEADGTASQEVRTLYYEKLVPLSVAFRYPQDMARMTDAATVAAAIVTSSKGVAKVSVTLNGTEVHQEAERSPQKSLVVTVPLKLREGVNTISITAGEPDGSVRQEVRTVILDQPQVAVAAPPPLPAPAHDRWAVVVGVGNYDSPDVPRLRYSVPDAEAMYDVLTGPGDFKKEHVLLLTDKTEKKPTYRNLKWALGTFLARSAKKDDTVLIYFAGHGAPEVDQRGVERDGFSKYLVPTDAEPDDLYSTALPMDELQTIFGRLEAERVIVFLDSCYSGAAGGRTFASKKTRAGHVDELFLERLTSSKGRAILTASRPAEVSMELSELGHGIFTYYLVQGLKGAADLNRDGIVTLQELYEYVEQQVTQKSRAVGGNQHPVMKGELEGVLPLVKVGGR